MPALVAPDSPAGTMSCLTAAGPGLAVEASAPPTVDVAGVPPGGVVVGWVLVADEEVVGGARVDPVFLAAGRAWTPDQYRAAYGLQLNLSVVHG